MIRKFALIAATGALVVAIGTPLKFTQAWAVSFALLFILDVTHGNS